VTKLNLEGSASAAFPGAEGEESAEASAFLSVIS